MCWSVGLFAHILCTPTTPLAQGGDISSRKTVKSNVNCAMLLYSVVVVLALCCPNCHVQRKADCQSSCRCLPREQNVMHANQYGVLRPMPVS